MDSQAFTVNGWSDGIAWRCYGPVMVRDEDWEWSGIEEPHPNLVQMVMVGDDKIYEVDKDDIVPLDEDAYCHECGQVGCGHG
jgi:hypothetical protein